MKGTLLRFYVHENRKHRHILLYEWLLEQAKKMGIHGGSAFRAIAGFGRHGVIHEERFFELASDLTVEIDFAVSDKEAETDYRSKKYQESAAADKSSTSVGPLTARSSTTTVPTVCARRSTASLSSAATSTWF